MRIIFGRKEKNVTFYRLMVRICWDISLIFVTEIFIRGWIHFKFGGLKDHSMNNGIELRFGT